MLAHGLSNCFRDARGGGECGLFHTLGIMGCLDVWQGLPASCLLHPNDRAGPAQ